MPNLPANIRGARAWTASSGQGKRKCRPRTSGSAQRSVETQLRGEMSKGARQTKGRQLTSLSGTRFRDRPIEVPFARHGGEASHRLDGVLVAQAAAWKAQRRASEPACYGCEGDGFAGCNVTARRLKRVNAGAREQLLRVPGPNHPRRTAMPRAVACAVFHRSVSSIASDNALPNESNQVVCGGGALKDRTRRGSSIVRYRELLRTE
jgi:hypothetical protein